MEEFEVEGLGKIRVTSEAPLDKCVEELSAEGYDMIGIRDLAFARVHSVGRAREYLQGNGTFVAEKVMYYKEKPYFLANFEKISAQHLKPLVAANKQGIEHFLLGSTPYGVVESAQALRDVGLIKGKPLVFSFLGEELDERDKDGNIFFPTGNLDSIAFTKWALEDAAKDYGNLLTGRGIETLPLWLPKQEYLCELESKPFMRQVWVCCIVDERNPKIVGMSGISGNNRSTHEGSRLVGIKKYN